MTGFVDNNIEIVFMGFIILMLVVRTGLNFAYSVRANQKFIIGGHFFLDMLIGVIMIYRIYLEYAVFNTGDALDLSASDTFQSNLTYFVNMAHFDGVVTITMLYGTLIASLWIKLFLFL